jgi:hypothetical protein
VTSSWTALCRARRRDGLGLAARTASWRKHAVCAGSCPAHGHAEGPLVAGQQTRRLLSAWQFGPPRRSSAVVW